MRLAGKAGIVVGAGQTPGKTVGTGRAAALVFAREGAKVMLADRNLASAQETAAMIADAGGVAEFVRADWTNAADCQAMAAACLDAWGRIDFLQNNVGIGAGDSDPLRLTEEAFDRIITVNLKGCVLSCQAVLPVMRDQGAGSIVNLIDRRTRRCDPADRVQAVEGRDQRAQPIARDRQRRARHPRQHDHARLARHADGGRRTRRAHRSPA
jgi:NAD(P)-dependent dehydrogenase (short-subunit alcohol dehydrogenase family)